MFKKLNNESGAILIITLTFMLAFTSLGIASMYHANMQNELSERLRASTEALWIADGAVQRAFSQTPGTLYNASNPANNGVALGRSGASYDISSQVDTCGQGPTGPIPCADRWQINATGRVPQYEIGGQQFQIRKIEADASKFDIANAITTKGTVNDDCQHQSQGGDIFGTCAAHFSFTFEQIFNGTSYTAVTQNANHYYLNPGNNDITSVSEVSFVELTGNNKSININTDNQTLNNGVPVGTFLIVDANGVNSNGNPSDKVQISIAGGYDFYGILWIKADQIQSKVNIQFVGNTSFKGTIFIEGSASQDSKLSGSSDVSYDAQAIEEAVSQIPTSIYTSELQIVSWKEI